MADLQINRTLPKGYRLVECFDADNILCGCKQAVKKRQRDGQHKWPQCRAHGHKKEDGCERLVQGMAAHGVRGAIHQWPMQAEAHCDRQGAARDKSRRSANGGRFQKGRRSHVDVVYVRAGEVVVGIEVDGSDHAERRVKRADASKNRMAARSGMLLHRLNLRALDSKQDWDWELLALAAMVGHAP